MKVKEIKLNALINVGPYSHVTMDLVAELNPTEDALVVLETFKSRVEKIMQGIPVGNNLPVSQTQLVEEVKPEPETVAEEPVKEKKTRVKKEKPVETEQEVPPVIQEPKKKEVKTVAYDSTIAEHKSILAGYLAKKYDTAWKTVAPAEEIKAFTSSLNGQPFLDDVGNILPVFLEEIHTFFGL